MRAALTAAMIMCLATSAMAAEEAGFLPWKDPAAVAQGQGIYTDHCAACHGDRLQGEPDWQTRDADGYLPAPPHDPSGHTWHHPDRQLFEITKYGIEAIVGGSYKSRMAGYQDILSDAEIAAVLAYIKSTWPPRVIAVHDRINRDASDR
ncbi:MAG: cytochrome C [Rhodobacterales bacterium 34-62-10]|nr:MAG: cytochrome C [Rhodobacterales bacterium 34-62-10]